MAAIPGKLDIYLEKKRDQLASVQHELGKLGDIIDGHVEAKRWAKKQRKFDKAQEFVTEQLHGTYLGAELQRAYGINAVAHTTHRMKPQTGEKPSPNPPLIETLMTERLRKHEESVDRKEESVRRLQKKKKELIEQRQRLLEERKHLLSQNGNSDYFADFDDSLTEPDERLQTIDDLVENVKAMIPESEERVRQLKAELLDYDRRFGRPYMGELGVDSYEPWQRQDYLLMKDLVNDIVEQAMDDFVRRVPTGPGQLADQERILANSRTQVAEFKMAAVKQKVTQLICEEIIILETRNLAEEVVREYISLNLLSAASASDLVIGTTETLTTGNEEGRTDKEDLTYNLVTKAYHRMTADRNERRAKLWLHTQYLLHVKPDRQSDAQEDDVEYTDYLGIEPFKTKDDETYTIMYKEYCEREVIYWSNLVPTSIRLNVTLKTAGVSCGCVNHTQRFLAVGTMHGDVLVYDLHVYPPLVYRYVTNENKENDPVRKISFSLDGTRLATVNNNGSLRLWSLVNGEISAERAATLGLGPDEEGFLPEELQLLVELFPDKGDFVFQEGPLASAGSVGTEILKPRMAVFHTSLTLLGSQNNLALGMENGDILRCELEDLLLDPTSQTGRTIRPIFDDVINEPNFLGEDLEAELFRAHKNPLVHIGFVNNLGPMVSVDDKGYIFFWRYSRDAISNYEWFEPESKQRIVFAERIFEPVPNKEPKILFSAKPIDKKKRKTMPSTPERRNRADNYIDEQELGKPWAVSVDPKTSVTTYIYKVKDPAPTGSPFSIIKRNKNNDLIYFSKEFYRPAKLAATKLLHVRATPDGSKLVFGLLIPANGPRKAHITFLLYDLLEKDLEDWRIDLDLSAAEYQEAEKPTMVNFDVTRTHDCLRTPYLICNILGSLYGYSLTTGNLVMACLNNGFDGLNLTSLQAEVASNARLVVANRRGAYQIITFAPGQNYIDLINLEDRNDVTERQDVWRTFKMLQMSPYIDLPPKLAQFSQLPEQVAVTHPRNLDQSSFYNIEHWCFSLVLSIMDDVIQETDGEYPTDIKEMYELLNDLQPYDDLDMDVFLGDTEQASEIGSRGVADIGRKKELDQILGKARTLSRTFSDPTRGGVFVSERPSDLMRSTAPGIVDTDVVKRKTSQQQPPPPPGSGGLQPIPEGGTQSVQGGGSTANLQEPTNSNTLPVQQDEPPPPPTTPSVAQPPPPTPGAPTPPPTTGAAAPPPPPLATAAPPPTTGAAPPPPDASQPPPPPPPANT